MKIVLDDPNIGKFEWQLPKNVAKHFLEAGDFLKKNIGIHEITTSCFERREIDRVTKSIQCFLLILKASIHEGCGIGNPLTGKIIKKSLERMEQECLTVSKKNRRGKSS